MAPRVHLLINESYLDYVSYTLGVVLPDSFEAAGANIVMHGDMRSLDVGSDDVIIAMGGIDDVVNEVHSRFKPERRWSFVCDVQKADDIGPYVRATNYAKNVIDTNNIITTYETSEHMKWLEDAGFKHVTMPHCMKEIRLRTRKTKPIIMTGQVDMKPKPGVIERVTNLYTMRTDIADALLASDMRNEVTWLTHPGHSLSTLKHDVVFDRYLEVLDSHRIGIVCKGGVRDSMVSKYVEFGASHVLPIGDCPSYMPQAMKDAMVNVEGWSGPQIVAEVKRLLANYDELEARTEAYVKCVEERYLGVPNAARVMREITNVG